MCGIFFACSPSKKVINKCNSRLDQAINTIKFRGPDSTNIVRSNRTIAVHTHLRITGYREQPVVTNDFLLLFNGEIYNEFETYHTSSALSDTDFLIDLISDESQEYFSKLDGEFALCIYKPKLNSLLLVSDFFGTKPIYYQLGKNYCLVGTYNNTISACSLGANIEQVPANTLLEINLDNFSIKTKKKLRSLDFSKQNENSYNKWCHAFKNSILKRTINKKQKYFVSFSSGHDSGLIAAQLLSSNIPFFTYAVPYLEDQKVLVKRLDILKENNIKYEIMRISKEEYQKMKKYLHQYLVEYQLISNEFKVKNFPDPDMRNNPGLIASAIIHRKARKNKHLVALSGQGADEIFADYYNEGASCKMSELKGNWNNLKKPWKNINGGWNRVFLGAAERIAGLFGIETRYPFLDFDLVQEFVNLRPKLKGKEYKAPLTACLRKLNFPHHFRKQGFAGFEEY
jgi:asparagine synthetase B (glutamine-hydrolysing)